MATRPPIPAVVKIPPGYRRAKPGEITPAVQAFARQALKQARPIGKRQAARVEGKQFEAITEWTKDPWWHPGISIVVPITPIPETKLAAAKPKTTATGQRVVAYDPFARPGATTNLSELMDQADKKVV
jgi:hypothetical protein